MDLAGVGILFPTAGVEFQLGDDQPHIIAVGVGGGVGVDGIFRGEGVVGRLGSRPVKAHVQVAVQRGKAGVGRVVQRFRGGGLVGIFDRCFQLGHVTGVQHFKIVGRHGKAQGGALGCTGRRLQHGVRRGLALRRRKDGKGAVGIGQLAADGLGQGVGQVLGAGKLLHRDIRLGAGLDQRDRRHAEQRQQHQADHQLNEGRSFFIVQRGGHGVVSSLLSAG